MNNGQNPNLFSSGMYGQHQMGKPEQSMYHQPYGNTPMYGAPQGNAQGYGGLMRSTLPIRTTPGTPDSSVEAYSKTHTRDDQGGSVALVSLTGKPVYKNYSIEEIRAADYQRDRKGTIVPAARYGQAYSPNQSYSGNSGTSFGGLGMNRSGAFYQPKSEPSPLSSFGQNRYLPPAPGHSGFGQTAPAFGAAPAQNKPFGAFGGGFSQPPSNPASPSVFGSTNRLGTGNALSQPGTVFGSMGNSLQPGPGQPGTVQSNLMQPNPMQPNPMQSNPLQQPSSLFGGQSTGSAPSGMQSPAPFGQLGAPTTGFNRSPFGLPAQPRLGGLGQPSQPGMGGTVSGLGGLGGSQLGVGGGLGGAGLGQPGMGSGLFGQSPSQNQTPSGLGGGLGSGLGGGFRPATPSGISSFGSPAAASQPGLGGGIGAGAPMQSSLGGSFLKPALPAASPFAAAPAQPAGGSFFGTGSAMGYPGQGQGQEQGQGQGQNTGMGGLQGSGSGLGLSAGGPPTGQAPSSTPFSFMNKPAETAPQESKPFGMPGLGGLGGFGAAGPLGSSSLGAGGLAGGGAGSSLGTPGLGQSGSALSGGNSLFSKPPGLFGDYKSGQPAAGASEAFAAKPAGAGFGGGFGAGFTTTGTRSGKTADPYLISELSFKECEEYEKRKRLETPKLLFERPIKPKIKFKANVPFKSVAASAPFKFADVVGESESEYEKNQYYTIPPIEKLKAMRDKKVYGLVVGKKGAGAIEYRCEVNLNEVDLDNLAQDVVFMDGSVRMYPTRDVDVGVGLNRPSRVILENVFAYSKSTGFRIQGKRETSPYKELQEQILRSATEGKKARIISYDYDTGLLEMEVDHF